jgi:hypothetical protein
MTAEDLPDDSIFLRSYPQAEQMDRAEDDPYYYKNVCKFCSRRWIDVRVSEPLRLQLARLTVEHLKAA